MSEEKQLILSPPPAETTPDGKRIERLPSLRNQDRFTLQFNAHHEHRGDAPVSVAVVASLGLKTLGIEPWTRRIEITEEWKPLLVGCWIEPKDVGYLILENRTGRERVTHPTLEEKEAIEGAVIQLAYADSLKWTWDTPPGMPYLGYPSHPEFLVVRSAKGLAKARLTVYPK